MGLFATPAVRELQEQAELIGGLHRNVYMGAISAADLAEIVNDASYCSRLREAYDAAARDAGEKKALKKAIVTARIWAEGPARNRGDAYGNVGLAAERSIRQMLGAPK